MGDYGGLEQGNGEESQDQQSQKLISHGHFATHKPLFPPTNDTKSLKTHTTIGKWKRG